MCCNNQLNFEAKLKPSWSVTGSKSNTSNTIVVDQRVKQFLTCLRIVVVFSMTVVDISVTLPEV